jgi:hypothetical protein
MWIYINNFINPSKVLWTGWRFIARIMQFSNENNFKKSSILWDITQYSSLRAYRRFAGKFHSHLQGPKEAYHETSVKNQQAEL